MSSRIVKCQAISQISRACARCGRRHFSRAADPTCDSSSDALPLFIGYSPESTLGHCSSHFVRKAVSFVIPPRVHLQMVGWRDWAEVEFFVIVRWFMVLKNDGSNRRSQGQYRGPLLSRTPRCLLVAAPRPLSTWVQSTTSAHFPRFQSGTALAPRFLD